MGEMIQKPDTNPILVAVLNWLGFGGVGYLVMGQQKKGIMAIVIFMVLTTLTCGMGGLIGLVFAYDAYLLGQKLQNGEAIGMNENGLDFLNAIFKD